MDLCFIITNFSGMLTFADFAVTYTLQLGLRWEKPEEMLPENFSCAHEKQSLLYSKYTVVK